MLSIIRVIEKNVFYRTTREDFIFHFVRLYTLLRIILNVLRSTYVHVHTLPF